MKIKIKKLTDRATIPTKATEGSIAYDVYLPEATSIRPGRQIVGLGFAIELPTGIEAKIEPRSGFSSKGMEDIIGERKDADVLVGKIDSDYRGQVGVIIKSNCRTPFILDGGTRIAQMTLYKTEDADFIIADELSETERGDGGFGHSGN